MDYPNYVTQDDGSAVRTALHSGASVIPDGSVRHGETYVRPTASQLRPNPNKQSRYELQGGGGNESLSRFSS